MAQWGSLNTLRIHVWISLSAVTISSIYSCCLIKPVLTKMLPLKTLGLHSHLWMLSMLLQEFPLTPALGNVSSDIPTPMYKRKQHSPSSTFWTSHPLPFQLHFLRLTAHKAGTFLETSRSWGKVPPKFLPVPHPLEHTTSSPSLFLSSKDLPVLWCPEPVRLPGKVHSFRRSWANLYRVETGPLSLLYPAE